MIGDPLLGPAGDGDDDEHAARAPATAAPDDPETASSDVEAPEIARPDAASPPEPADAPTRVVPAPIIPPGGLGLGSRPAPDAVDPLWAATTAPAPTAATPPGISTPGLAAEPATPVTGIDLTATTMMPAATDLTATGVLPATGDHLAPTQAMPGVVRSGGPDTAVMPAVAAPAPGAEHAPGFERAMRRHRRRWWRRSFKALLLLVFVGIVYVGVNFALVLRTAHTDQARQVDVIVVLGAAQYNGRPSPQLQARLDHTVDLWNEGLATTVFVTGGNQPGDAFTEASTSRDYLVQRGVPEGAIQMEDTANSTWESLSNFAEIADRQGWRTVLLVTDPFHSLRSRLIAQELGFTAYTSPTRTSPVQGREEVAKEVKEALGISLGRIIGFERLWKLTG